MRDDPMRSGISDDELIPGDVSPDFVCLLDLLGLSHDDAADLLGLKKQSISLKATNRRSVRYGELRQLRYLWTLMLDHAVDSLPAKPESLRVRARMIKKLGRV